MTLYDDLGVKKDARPETIRKAYLKRAKQHHPDKGGDVSKFHQAKLAYDVLSNPVRRERYDRDGSTGDERDTQTERALGEIVEAFDRALLSGGSLNMDKLRQSDVIMAMRNHIKGKLTSVNHEVKNFKEVIVALKETGVSHR